MVAVTFSFIIAVRELEAYEGSVQIELWSLVIEN